MIFHRIRGVNYSVRQSPNYIDQQMKQRNSMAMKISRGRGKHVSKRQDSDLWVKVSNENTGIDQRQDFNDYQ